MKYFFLRVNANKSNGALSKQTKRVVDYIQERYDITITGMEVGWINDDFIRNTMRFKVAYEKKQQDNK